MQQATALAAKSDIAVATAAAAGNRVVSFIRTPTRPSCSFSAGMHS
ncbi:hypothetical protein ACQPZP_26030 [Spirillospora sp. CA-142024]